MLDAPNFLDPRARVVFYGDDETPSEFVVEILRAVFGASPRQAADFVATIEDEGAATFGVFPSSVASALLEAADARIARAGHKLVVKARPTGAASVEDEHGCGGCGRPIAPGAIVYSGARAPICEACLLGGAAAISDATRTRQFKFAHEALAWHFAGLPRDQIASTSREFPGHMRVDIQAALDRHFVEPPIRFFGILEQMRYETLTLAMLTRDGANAPTIAPAQYQDIDIGEHLPARCLVNGLWLCRDQDLSYAVVLSAHREYGQEAGICVEMAVPVGERGGAFTSRFFSGLEAAIQASRSYRGKVLSFDTQNDYRGRSRGVIVHRLPPVHRDEVILPEPTLKLLDRNVLAFVAGREGLRALGQSTRKGILLYGPPGTGKTHTIRYLASSLPGHTTLIITAEQVGLLGQYMSLARLLQPALVVIEDVDLIARSREDMGGPCEESLLNKLLNEMDGLKDDADILFALTTNRPEQLEAALAGRPGRIDQAIEVPLPNAIGRAKLVTLYGRGLELTAPLVDEAVRRTEGVSAAFIKELMRRTAQASLARGGGPEITPADIVEALDEMLFTGGKLNLALLGGATDAAAA
jgi:ATP-dependent Clp protease adapter protein ClpS